ncbi:MAG: phosphate ABC transporter ATP-binding protein [Elusimicrobia bacterium RIFOXYC2_FULL_34_12]|nr:MAG: phosphate ABC transporter ATP-binding protein [Elusimicrobia bacterium RIFOXYC2_FULL_34_12]OGS39348.1 MAG: phosphate ABC transporter ATP-binding protein [Elusimicrobia bacterium RIFOXYD2_FULL_34_30]
MIKIKSEKLDAYFDNKSVISSLNIEIFNNEILGIIGPANSGKTTFLRCLNRLNDLFPNFVVKGKILIDNQNINDKKTDVDLLRKKVGMVFALPLPLPLSVFENVVYGPKRQGIKDKKKLEQIAEKSLTEAYLWDEIKDRLDLPAMKLSGGQQQRLCIARTLAVEPEIILFDEPCSGLDPISTAKVEEAMLKLKEKYTIVLVTNNTKQAARVSDRVAFFLMGELVEIDKTEKMFTNPKDKRTNDYISGKFG